MPVNRRNKAKKKLKEKNKKRKGAASRRTS